MKIILPGKKLRGKWGVFFFKIVGENSFFISNRPLNSYYSYSAMPLEKFNRLIIPCTDIHYDIEYPYNEIKKPYFHIKYSNLL